MASSIGSCYVKHKKHLEQIQLNKANITVVLKGTSSIYMVQAVMVKVIYMT